MKKITVFTAIMLASVLAFSQTKRIAHRSHSGKNHTFSFLGGDNFGLPSGGIPEMKPGKKVKPNKDSLKTTPPAKTDSTRKDSLRNVPTPITHVVTKDDVYYVLLAARKRLRDIGLL